jgi:hypothetical protein
MIMNQNRDSEPKRPAGSRRYAPPQLFSYGALGQLTLGGSPGMGDSGNPATKQTAPPLFGAGDYYGQP